MSRNLPGACACRGCSAWQGGCHAPCGVALLGSMRGVSGGRSLPPLKVALTLGWPGVVRIVSRSARRAWVARCRDTAAAHGCPCDAFLWRGGGLGRVRRVRCVGNDLRLGVRPSVEGSR